MKKLEDIPKTQIFTTPDEYFDKLAVRIQDRITSKRTAAENRPYLISKLKYALPVVALLVAVFFWFNNSQKKSDPESLLASIQTEDLIAYLNDSELTTDELLQTVNFNNNDLNEIEEEVYQLNINDKDFNDTLED